MTPNQRNRKNANAQLYRVKQTIALGKEVRLRKAYPLVTAWLFQHGIEATVLERSTTVKRSKKQMLEDEFDKRLQGAEHSTLLDYMKRDGTYVRDD